MQTFLEINIQIHVQIKKKLITLCLSTKDYKYSLYLYPSLLYNALQHFPCPLTPFSVTYDPIEYKIKPKTEKTVGL